MFIAMLVVAGVVAIAFGGVLVGLGWLFVHYAGATIIAAGVLVVLGSSGVSAWKETHKDDPTSYWYETPLEEESDEC